MTTNIYLGNHFIEYWRKKGNTCSEWQGTQGQAQQIEGIEANSHENQAVLVAGGPNRIIVNVSRVKVHDP